MDYIIHIVLNGATLIYVQDNKKGAIDFAKKVAKGNHLQEIGSVTRIFITHEYDTVYSGIIRGLNTRVYTVHDEY